jgi:acetyl esterase/lipase
MKNTKRFSVLVLALVLTIILSFVYSKQEDAVREDITVIEASSPEMAALKERMKQMSKEMFNASQIDVEKIRGVLQESYSGQKIEKGAKLDLDTFDGVDVAICSPEHITSENIVYYVHGGGLVTGDRLTAVPYASQLALATGSRVVSCSYRLAPEYPFPAGFDDSYAVYKYLIEKKPNSKISLIGESGGAYLSLVLALRTRDEKIKLPSSVIINSIVADMSDKIQRVDSPEETTVSVAALKQLAKLYAPNQELKNPYISPIYADFTGLPPLKVVYDKDEVLAIDSKLVAEKAKKAGVLVDITEYKNCFHAFTTTGKGTPESNRELSASAKFILDSFNKQN